MTDHAHTVAARVPADPRFVQILRTVAAGAATAAGTTMDALFDLRIAVDEACSILLRTGVEALEMRVAPAGGGALEVVVGAPGPRSGAPADDLSLLVLRALSAWVVYEPRAAGGPVVRFATQGPGR